MLPPFDSGEHAFWVGGPDEGFGIEVCLGDEAVDGGLQINAVLTTRNSVTRCTSSTSLH
jgi:hypothetical protein